MRPKLHPLLLLALISCSQLEDDFPGQPESALPPADLSTIMADPSLPFYSDLSGTATKAGPATVSLESMINRLGIKTTTSGGTTLVQIPFHDQFNGPQAYFGTKPEGDENRTAHMKKFLIASGRRMFVVAMVTDRDYADAHPGYDFLDKPDYTGAVVFSTLLGSVMNVRYYESGLIRDAVLTDRDVITVPGRRVGHIWLYGAPETKSILSIFGGRLHYSIIVADRDDDEDDDDQDNSPFFGAGNNNDGYDFDYGGGPTFGTGGGSSNGQGNGGNSSNDTKDEKSFTVRLSCDLPQYYDVTGSGTYTEGSTVTVKCMAKNYVVNYSFDHWTGYFSGRQTASFTHKVTCDIESTAYFSTGQPCVNKATGRMNPLEHMAVAASNNKGNYWGGTYGFTRTDRDSGQARKHAGLDLYAEVGTPVYAAYEGEVTLAVSSYGNKYAYRSFGNEIQIRTVSGSSAFTAQYAHLQAGNPIAVNPRTGQPFKAGDKVYQGDLIGYTGRTGNATEVPNPHLHFGIKVGGSWVDPKSYINGSYDAGQASINRNKGKVSNIRCD